MGNIKEFQTDMLKVKISKTREEMGKEAALDVSRRLKALLSIQDEVNMIFAAAPSQNEFLEYLIQLPEIDWSRVNAFHIDEYIGLPADAPQGFGNFLKDKIFGRLPFKNVYYINGNAGDIESECIKYTGLLKKHPADIVCMGIGENGHIAFNDPHVARFDDEKYVKVVDLDEKCRMQQVHDGCFGELQEVPQYAVTLTIPELINPTYIYCIVPGATKAQAVFNTVRGTISESCPASILRTHSNAMLYTDMDSGKRILGEP